MRDPVEQVPHTEKTIAVRAERKFGEGALKRAKGPMHRADHEVSTGAMDAGDVGARHDGLTRWNHREKRRIPTPP